MPCLIGQYKVVHIPHRYNALRSGSLEFKLDCVPTAEYNLFDIALMSLQLRCEFVEYKRNDQKPPLLSAWCLRLILMQFTVSETMRN
jgi:hypothetical protein